MHSAVHDINSAFNSRLVPLAAVGSPRPVNPFASTGVQTSKTKNDEMKVRASVTLPGTLGAQYKGKVIDTKSDDSVRLDTYTIGENPKAKTTKHSTTRLQIEHTRER
ncbi:unnamed protein product [Ectocarpus sp. 12 AP-2014]